MKSLTLKLSSILVAVGILASCANLNNTQKGTGIGAGAGAAAGALIGHFLGDGNAAMGAAIGAAVGGGTGAIIGKQMDKQAQAIEQTVAGAEVEKINDGQALEVTFSDSKDGITFATNSSTLSANSKVNLEKLAGIFQEFPDTYLEVCGHTDDTGAATYNQTLSEKRAKSVADYLIAQGVSSSRIEVQGFGEDKPRVPNSSDINRSKNRRVEVFIVPSEKMINDAKGEAGE